MDPKLLCTITYTMTHARDTPIYHNLKIQYPATILSQHLRMHTTPSFILIATVLNGLDNQVQIFFSNCFFFLFSMSLLQAPGKTLMLIEYQGD